MFEFLYEFFNVPPDFEVLVGKICILTVLIGFGMLALSNIISACDKSTGKVITYDAVRKEIS